MHTPGLCSLLGYKSTEEQIWIQASKSYLFWKNLTEGTIFTTMCTYRARVKKKCSSQASASQRNMHSSRERLEFFSFEPVCVSCPGPLRFVVSNPIVSVTGPAGELRVRQTYLLARETAGGFPLVLLQLHVHLWCSEPCCCLALSRTWILPSGNLAWHHSQSCDTTRGEHWEPKMKQEPSMGSSAAWRALK